MEIIVTGGIVRKKKNRFTLIKLPAVIVILAIIALIVTPLILKVISEAKLGAWYY